MSDLADQVGDQFELDGRGLKPSSRARACARKNAGVVCDPVPGGLSTAVVRGGEPARRAASASYSCAGFLVVLDAD
jgi:hypothetical protein